MTSTDFSENALVEQPAIALFEDLGYTTANCFYEKVGGPTATLGRETTNDVILWPRLKTALQKLNPGVANDAIQLAMDELGKDRSAMGLAQANLDNRLIREVVVKILASIKLKRQVIIATHNPNLPVLGDVEQAIILRAVEDNKCQLQATGNLDEANVVRLITEIMEGGREAFQYRHSIYQPYWEGPVDDGSSA